MILFIPIVTCTVLGVTYANGAEFLHPDGCNECSCTSGVATCTTTICSPTNGTVTQHLYDKTTSMSNLNLISELCVNRTLSKATIISGLLNFLI